MTRPTSFFNFFVSLHLGRNSNLILNQGVIVDSGFVEIPRQRNTREENKAIKEDRGSELWNDEDDDTEDDKKKKVNKKRHKDTDARWTKNGGQTFYGCKTHAKIDAKSKLMKKSVTTSAEQYDSVPTKLLIDSDDYGQELYADRNVLTSLVYNMMRYEQIQRLGMN